MMPFYGRFDHLRLAVESVLAQTDPDWRLVVVDDVYPDLEPGAWVCALDDSRISYRRNDVNLGVSANFRRCADLMSGTFGTIMGCDDVLRPRYVKRVSELVDQFPDASLIQPGVEVIDSDGRAVRPLADRVKSFYRGRATGVRTLSGETLATSLLRGNWAYFPSVVWRASEIQTIGFRLDLLVVQDLAMMLQMISRGAVMVVDDEIVFDYRRHAASVSSVSGPDGSKFIEERDVMHAAADEFDLAGWHRAARVGRRHLSSRLHAATELPRALRTSSSSAQRTIIHHILGLRYPGRG